MEFFIPSLIVLLLSALVCLVLLPKLAPYVLGGAAVVMFILGIWQHYVTFPYEYKASMFTDLIREYAGFFMSLAVILVSIGFILGTAGLTGSSGNSNNSGNSSNSGNSGNSSNSGNSNNTKANNTNNSSMLPAILSTPVADILPNLTGNANGKANNAKANNANKKNNNLASTSFKVV
jgi:hypothetical protein